LTPGGPGVLLLLLFYPCHTHFIQGDDQFSFLSIEAKNFGFLFNLQSRRKKREREEKSVCIRVEREKVRVRDEKRECVRECVRGKRECVSESALEKERSVSQDFQLSQNGLSQFLKHYLIVCPSLTECDSSETMRHFSQQSKDFSKVSFNH